MSGSFAQDMAPLQQQNPAMATVNRVGSQQIADQPYDENVGYTNQYNTPLTPNEEAQYQAWGKWQAQQRPDHRNPAQDTYDYDMRGFWKSGGQFAQNGHAGDQFKKPNHPTFSTFSQYSTPEMPGGTWGKAANGAWTFTPSQQNLKFHDAGDLQEYFATQEKGNQLVLGQSSGAPAPQVSVNQATTQAGQPTASPAPQAAAASPLAAKPPAAGQPAVPSANLLGASAPTVGR
jgi:hypothetical protein